MDSGKLYKFFFSFFFFLFDNNVSGRLDSNGSSLRYKHSHKTKNKKINRTPIQLTKRIYHWKPFTSYNHNHSQVK